MSQGTYRAAIEGSDITFDVKSNETLVKAAARQNISFPSICNVGECGSCRCTLREGRVKLKKDISHHVPQHLLSQGHILGCQSQIQSDVILNVPTLSPANKVESTPVQSKGHITSLRALNDDIVEVNIRLEQKMNYQAGQFGHLTIPSVSELAATPRSYSFASGESGRDPYTVKFHIRHVPGGVFTGWLFDGDRSGEALTVTGPFGDFGWREETIKPLFIAGGSGFAPIHALLESCIEKASPLDAVFIYGARQRKDIYCLSRIGQLQKHWPGQLTFLPVLSEEAEDSDWPGSRGFVHDVLKTPLVQASERTAYMCGPPPMIDACLETLSGVIASENIHYDKFLDRSHMNELADA